MNHRDLCDLAVKWLYRPNSAGGHGCNAAVSECKTGWHGEVPDAIGFRSAGWMDGSVVVECKTSRADFLADAKKPHRAEGGVGNWRYYLAPAGLIATPELPDGWGLLEVNSRGHIKPVAGAALYFRGRHDEMVHQLAAWRQVANLERERWLLAKVLARVGDPEKLNRSIAEATWHSQRLAKTVEKLREQLSAERMKVYALRTAAKSTEMV